LLAPGQRVHLRFRLLRPVETPTLVLRYRGEEHHLTVLPRARGAEGVRVRAVQPQLAASFGEEARFQFLVENLSERSQKLVLAVEGLPPACPFRFWDPQAQADVTALQLEPWAPPKPLELRVMLPQGETPGLRAQEPLHFAAQWVPDRGQPERVSLSLVPRGVPQVEVTTTTWLRETTVGKPLSFPLRVVNRGTAPASAVRLVLQAPEGFTWQLQPEELELLAPGSHREVTVILRATSLPEGEYTVRLLCQWSQGATTARGHEALLRVRLKSSGWVGGLLILALVTAGAAAGWFSWRKLRAD
ncbi:MAG: NEW3 domain-containing protein, partial [Thermoanaerobaculum sp.]|nr:NEW3 domain-containing protein [Thermoanaerobaculum sp.]